MNDLAQDLRSALEERRPGGRAGDVYARLCRMIDSGEMPEPYTGPRSPEGERVRAALLASIEAEAEEST